MTGMAKPWRIQARDDHFAVLGASGDEMLYSVKEYESAGNAKRAARNFAEAMAREVVLEYEGADGVMVQETVSAPTAVVTGGNGGGVITPPVDGKSAHASSPLATGNG